jgi:hypothetical protein
MSSCRSVIRGIWLAKTAADMKRGFQQALISAAVLAIVVAALISVDDQVRQRFTDLFSGGVSPWAARATDLGGAVMSALRHQSIENAPLLIFAAAGAVLFVFMVRA